MTNTTQKRSFGRRINDWLDEPDGEQFSDGKWRFWLPAVFGFSVLNAVLTVLIFRESASANYLTPALLAASAIVGWIAIGCLHYSDAKRGRMARGVSALDSASLLFVIGHFCFLVYILGHSWILRGAEKKYEQDIATYNAQAEKISADNKQIIEAAARIAETEKQTERLRNDTAYWSRKNRVKVLPSGVKVEVSTSKVEMPPPPKAPEDSQAAFLTRWDAWVRITNFGELILAALTLIFIRNWTAKTNTSSPAVEGFPDEIDVDVIEERSKRSPSRRADFAVAPSKKARRSSSVLGPDHAKEKTQGDQNTGLEALRAALSDISFYHPGISFKADLKPDLPRKPDHVRIRAMRANQGTQETIHSVRMTLDVLNDAITMPRDAFIERLKRFLTRNGFEL